MTLRSALLLSAVAIAAVSTTPLAATAAPASRSVSPWVANSAKLGEADASKTVQISVYLSFKDMNGLKNLIAQQYNPRSPQYGKFLTPDQFRATYAPDAADVAKVQETLKSLGFKIDYTPVSGLFVTASGTVAQVKSAFGVSQRMYSYKGRALRANAEAPKIPASIAKIVTYVGGLDDSIQLRHHDHRRLDDDSTASSAAVEASHVTPNAPPPTINANPSPFCSTYFGDTTATLSTAPDLYPKKEPWLLCSYVPDQIRQAYGIDKVTQDGTGVRVGIVDNYASPTIEHDANKYSKHFGLPQLTYLNFQQIVPPGIYKVPASDPCGPQGWYGEETLDVEAVHTVAPGAHIIYAGNSCTDPGNSALYNLIDGKLVDIITNSYSYNGEGVPADFITSENMYFMQAAAEGVSVLFSSGDDSDLAAQNGIASGSWDATDNYVTAVGGTSLALYNANGKKDEWGWGNYRAYLANATVSTDGTTIATSGITPPFSYYSGSGGGVSFAMLQPDYQAGIVPFFLSEYTHLYGGTYGGRIVPLGTDHRVTPDISMVGDPYTGFLTGETYTTSSNEIANIGCTPLTDTTEYCYEGIGGTSLASPLFAGVLALVNQARFTAGKAAIGFANPTLYKLTVGKPGDLTAPVIDVQAPKTPTAVLRGYSTSNTLVRLVTMNSIPNAADTKVLEGKNTSLGTKKGYDDTTGIGVPNVPALIEALQ